MTDSKPRLIFITGPTAVGKTALSLHLAETFGGEVLSCDSMQLYRGMDIGTAKPTPEEQAKVRHHLIDILDIRDTFSVVDYQREAEQCIGDVVSRGVLPIFCGGTGLYLDAVARSTDFGDMPSSAALREELKALADEKGAEHLHAVLAACDPEAAAKIDYRNVKRVIRALEVAKVSGEPISFWQKRSNIQPPLYRSLILELEYDDRAVLRERIDRRVDLMMEQGLLDEVKQLYDAGLPSCTTAGQAIGYKEFYPYFEETDSLENCVEAVKIHSRQYAKRQMTWFRRKEELIRIPVDGLSPDELFEKTQKLCGDFLAAD